MYTLGILGAAGNMAQAMLRRWLSVGFLKPDQVIAADKAGERFDALLADTKMRRAEDNVALAQSADILLLAVKPHQLAPLCPEIGPAIRGKRVISIVTGWSHAMLEKAFGRETQILRTMPNTPALVGEGAFALSTAHTFDAQAYAWAVSLFQAVGSVFSVEEKDFDAVVGVSGSGPAYAFLFIEAMADAGVREGLQRDTAYQLATQTLLGAARMVQESGQCPAALKDAVASPSGTTIEAIFALEKHGFRSAVMEAVSAAATKAAAIRRGMEDQH